MDGLVSETAGSGFFTEFLEQLPPLPGHYPWGGEGGGFVEKQHNSNKPTQNPLYYIVYILQQERIND